VARPRKASDEEVYQAAFRVMGRVGPAQWTLADVADEVGLTAGALVQRFGSKRELQIALVRLYADGVPLMYAELRSRHRSPLAAVRAYARQVACLAESPEGLAHHLDYLRLDLTDPDMHVHFVRQAEAARAFLRGALSDAADAGELGGGADLERLTRLVETTITGSLFTWATYREGSAETWVLSDLDTALEPFAPAPPRRINREAASSPSTPSSGTRRSSRT
jgi:AcrR family transcriptional regulator